MLIEIQDNLFLDGYALVLALILIVSFGKLMIFIGIDSLVLSLFNLMRRLSVDAT